MLIQLFMRSIFAFYIALYDKRKVGCHTLDDQGNLTIVQDIIMEFYFIYSVGTQMCPKLLSLAQWWQV